MDRRVPAQQPPMQIQPDTGRVDVVSGLRQALGGVAQTAQTIGELRQRKRQEQIRIEAHDLPERVKTRIYDRAWEPDSIRADMPDFLETISEELRPRAEAMFNLAYRTRADQEQRAQVQAQEQAHRNAINLGKTQLLVHDRLFPEFVEQWQGDLNDPAEVFRLAEAFAEKVGIRPGTGEWEGFTTDAIKMVDGFIDNLHKTHDEYQKKQGVHAADTDVITTLGSWQQTGESFNLFPLWQDFKSSYLFNGKTELDARLAFGSLVIGHAKQYLDESILDKLPKQVADSKGLNIAAARDHIRKEIKRDKAERLAAFGDNFTAQMRLAETPEEISGLLGMIPEIPQLVDDPNARSARMLGMFEEAQKRFDQIRTEKANEGIAHVKSLLDVAHDPVSMRRAVDHYDSLILQGLDDPLKTGERVPLLTEAQANDLLAQVKKTDERVSKGQTATLREQTTARIQLAAMGQGGQTPEEAILDIAQEYGYIPPEAIPYVTQMIASDRPNGLSFAFNVAANLRPDNARALQDAVPEVGVAVMMKQGHIPNEQMIAVLDGSDDAERQAAMAFARGIVIEDPDYMRWWPGGGVDHMNSAFDSYVRGRLVYELLRRPGPQGIERTESGAQFTTASDDMLEALTKQTMIDAREQFPRVTLLGQRVQLQRKHVTRTGEAREILLDAEALKPILESQIDLGLSLAGVTQRVGLWSTLGFARHTGDWRVDFGGPRGDGLQELVIDGDLWLYAPVMLTNEDGFEVMVSRAFVPTSPEQALALREIESKRMEIIGEQLGAGALEGRRLGRVLKREVVGKHEAELRYIEAWEYLNDPNNEPDPNLWGDVSHAAFRVGHAGFQGAPLYLHPIREQVRSMRDAAERLGIAADQIGKSPQELGLNVEEVRSKVSAQDVILAWMLEVGLTMEEPFAN